MVSGRRRALESRNSEFDSDGHKWASYNNQRRDVETGSDAIKPSRQRQRFRDAIEQTMRETRAIEMKKKLIDNVDHEALEKYRKSEESVCVLCVGSRDIIADIRSAKGHQLEKSPSVLRGAKSSYR
jgi:nucleosome binding factor SPN SPT16 subunit